MAGWRDHNGRLDGQGVALQVDGIDTDQIIPARFMSTPREQGYGSYLMHDLRFDEQGIRKEDFPLNQHPGAKILVAGRNFGSGSSREAAVYTLVDYGIKVVVAPSFGDIFAANAVNNGLLPAKISAEQYTQLATVMTTGTANLSVDLNTATIAIADTTLPFDIAPVWRTKLLEGWDDIDMTANHAQDIASFRQADLANRPWAQLAGP
jgi:3-isopropylmalate/(R)-2-methylmalate dehydratase small subunit